MLIWGRGPGIVSVHKVREHGIWDLHPPGGGISRGKDGRNSRETRVAGGRR